MVYIGIRSGCVLKMADLQAQGRVVMSNPLYYGIAKTMLSMEGSNEMHNTHRGNVALNVIHPKLSAA